ncbi:MAG: Nif3-like dinuclear metal center hexameric protein [Enterobacteriaceae bacterium]
MNNIKLEYIINKKLRSDTIEDYTFNGLQIEGKKNINKIVTGVTACQKLLNVAVKKKADAIIVHHGYFWKNESKVVRGIKRNRFKTILSNNINLYAWHLPLDLHPKLGNNYQLAKILEINIKNVLDNFLFVGNLKERTNRFIFKKRIEKIFKKKIIYFHYNKKKKIKNVALCTGAGQNLLNKIDEKKIDTFITGEVGEQTMHLSKEKKINFYSLGHHDTEIWGILSLSNWLKKKLKIDVEFVNIKNPF